jgi:iron complex transport system substrate-binding protein
MKIRNIFVLWACLLVPLHAQTELVDALGRKFVLKSASQRVVSLSPAATEILFAVGAGGQVAGRTGYCNYPESALSVPVVGGFSGATVSVESIAVFALEPRTFEEVYAVIGIVGQLTGHE